MTSLSISCVIYDTEQIVFEKTISTLSSSVELAKLHRCITFASLFVIDNTVEQKHTPLLKQLISQFSSIFDEINIISGHGNIGYGRGNNLAITASKAKYHLILNPDVETAEDVLVKGLSYLHAHPDTGLIAPHAVNTKGEVEYLAKRTPTLLTIFLRGLNIGLLNKLFKKRLDSYAYKDKIPTTQPFEIELASGCFMLCDTATLKKVNGFSEEYFLYFEDFDLSQKIRRQSKIVHLPELRIIHHGGNTAAKGSSHIFLFLKSAKIFLKKHTPSKAL